MIRTYFLALPPYFQLDNYVTNNPFSIEGCLIKNPTDLVFRQQKKKKPEVASADDWYAYICYMLHRNRILLMEKMFLEGGSVWPFYIFESFYPGSWKKMKILKKEQKTSRPTNVFSQIWGTSRKHLIWYTLNFASHSWTLLNLVVIRTVIGHFNLRFFDYVFIFLP